MAKTNYHYKGISSFESGFLVREGQDPQMYRQIQIVTYMRERAKRASASEPYIFRSQNTSAHTINAVPFYYLWHGAV